MPRFSCSSWRDGANSLARTPDWHSLARTPDWLQLLHGCRPDCTNCASLHGFTDPAAPFFFTVAQEDPGEASPRSVLVTMTLAPQCLVQRSGSK